MSDIDLTDLLERITGCINNAEYDDEQETLTDAFAVIEAQAAEIERLGSVIDATALHWLALQDKHHVPWEGAIDGAMAAACAEIEKLREALRDIQIEAERERGNWTHLKQVIARKAHAALGETK